MKKIRIEEAVGETLCHDMTVISANGIKGVKFKRGHIITEENIPSLLDIGKTHVFVWEPDADEVHEDDAAIAVTKAVCGQNLTCSGPSEGKMQISAAADGLFCVKSEALLAINSLPDYTIACRPGYTRVSRGEKLAGARIVPLVTKRENVEKAVAIANRHYPVFSVLPFKPLKSGVIITGSEVYYDRIEDQFEPVMKKKLRSYGAEMLGFTKCPDDLGMISEAIGNYIKQGAELILLTGGMSVDPDDLTPAAIRNSGAKLITQGAPVQPGNMLTMAYLGDTLLMGVPGASLHYPVTSLEIFLPRVFAGISITREDIVGLGEGGFCIGCARCTYPLCYFGRK